MTAWRFAKGAGMTPLETKGRKPRPVTPLAKASLVALVCLAVPPRLATQYDSLRRGPEDLRALGARSSLHPLIDAPHNQRSEEFPLVLNARQRTGSDWREGKVTPDTKEAPSTPGPVRLARIKIQIPVPWTLGRSLKQPPKITEEMHRGSNRE